MNQPLLSGLGLIFASSLLLVAQPASSARQLPSPGLGVREPASSGGELGVKQAPRYVIGLQPGATAVDLAELCQLSDTTCVDGFYTGSIFELQANSGASPRAKKLLLAKLAADPRTLFAEPLFPLRTPEGEACLASPGPVAGLPCTISFYDGNPAPEKYYDQPLTPIIALDHAQSYLTGTPCVVAVLDTGVDATHSLLAARMYAPGFDFLENMPGAVDAPDGLDNDHDGLFDEATGHGTHVAGTILLINPDALILPLRVLDSDGNGNSFDVAKAIYFAVENGADIINLSLGMTSPSAAVAAALDFAATMEVEVYAAAGNTGKLGVNFPASYPTVLAVTAVDPLDVKALWASFGPEVGLAAPGVDIYSSMPGEAWAWWSGTSMATAVATGVGSMLISIEGVSGNAAEELVDHAAHIDSKNPGMSGWLGGGRIDAGAAVGED